MQDTRNLPQPSPRRLLRAAGVVLLMAAFTTGAIGLQHLQLKKMQSFRPYEDSLFLPRKEYAKVLAFGFDTFLADFLYLRSIQAFGGQWKNIVKDYASIGNYFETIAELDPRFIEAYEFGSMIIAENANQPERAIELNAIGRIHNPQNYKPSYWNAYISWWTLKDPLRTKFWVRMAEKAKNCPPHVSRLTTHIDKETGQYLAALDRWVQYYLDAIENRDEHMRTIGKTQFVDIVEKWNLDVLHRALKKYWEDNQEQLPETIQELDRKGYLAEYEGCDYPKLLTLLQGYEFTGIIPPGALENIIRQVAVPKSGIPRSPYGSTEEYRYVIRKDLLPGEIEEAIENKNMIVNFSDARDYTTRALLFMRNQVELFFLTHKHYPQTLEEICPPEEMPLDVIAGRWDYNPETGALDAPSFPEL